MENIEFSGTNFVPIGLSYIGGSEFKKEEVKFENSINTILHEGLKNPYDIGLNDKDFYTITDYNNSSDIFDNHFDEEYNKNFVTYLKTSDSYYLYHNGSEINVYSTQNLTRPYYFKINFNDNKTLYISQKLKDSVSEQKLYFDGSDFSFNNSDKTDFDYTIDYTNNILFLSLSGYGALNISPTGLSFTNNVNNINEYNYIKILSNDSIHSHLEISNSDLTTYNLGINIDKEYPHKTQKLITDSFKSNNTNILQLKNSTTNSNYHSLDSLSGANFKTYTGLHGGNKHNHYDKLFLGFDSNHHEIVLKSDQVNYFHVPSNIGDYSKININDLALIKNGAIGGNSPVNSDKIFKRLENYSKTNPNGNTFDQENGEYLCSWLFFNPQNPSESVWLDRYYIPKAITKLDALKTSTYDQLVSLIDKPDNFYVSLSSYSVENRIGDYKTGVFDVLSNLTFEPYAYYVYHHIGQNDSKKLIDNYLDNILIQDFSYYTGDYTEENSIKTYSFNGEYAYSALIPLIYENNFTLQFNIKLDNPYNVSGYNILGNFVDNRGIGLIKDDYYSPFIYTFENNEIVVFHCETKTVTHKFSIDNNVKFIIHANTFSRYFILDESNILYEINNNNVIINKYQIDTNKTVQDFYYYNNKIFFLHGSKYYFTFDINSYETSEDFYLGKNISSNKIIITKNGNVKTINNNNRIDITSDDKLFYLSDDAIWKQGYSTPLLSCGDINESIKDFVIDENDSIYVLTNYRLLKIQDDVNVRGNFATIDLHDIILAAQSTQSEDLSALSANGGETLMGVFQVNTPSKIGINRYMKDGINHKFIELYDYKFDNYQFYSFSDDFLYYKTIETTLSGADIVDFTYTNNMRYNKFNLDGKFKFKLTLQNIYNETDITYLTFPIDISEFENAENLFTFIFNNDLGNVTLFLNDRPIGTQQFNKNKYYFSNQLLNRKIFAAATLYDKETPLSDKLGEGFFISKGFSINNFKIYDFALNYYDILNTLRSLKGVEDIVFPIPIETRTYLDEISGIFKQNKNIRNSEYVNINIYSSLLTQDQKDLITEYINNDMLPELSVNKQILNINFI